MKALALLIGLAATAPACTAPTVVPGFEGWGKAVLPQLAAGAYSEVALAPAEAVHFSPPLNRAPEAGSRGGVYALNIKKDGSYRFAISPGAWIDVIGSKGQRLTSAAHTHGPACSGIGKIVDYVLPAGDYVVQFSATKAARLKVMLIGG